MFLSNKTAPLVMGIINMSPNSFMNPQKNLESALQTIEVMVAAGAKIIDVGGEATNPGVNLIQEAPSSSEEKDRVLPLISAIKKEFNVLISVDTSEPSVMQEALALGADMINFQQVKKNPEGLSIIAKAKAKVCLMHFFSPSREPGSSNLPTLLHSVKEGLAELLKMAANAGISSDNIILDPGFGGGNYGKNTQENFYLLAHLDEFSKLGYPLLLGWSRKSMVGEVLENSPPQERLFGSLAAEMILAQKGAAIIRTHDVKALCDMLKIMHYYEEVSLL